MRHIYTFPFAAFLTFASCSAPEVEQPCDPFCGTIVSTRHFRELQKVRITIQNDCGEIREQDLKLNAQQLASDNGVEFYINNFNLKTRYCVDNN